jgi:ribosomal-protein-alanine N-acetyltransferase
MARRDRDLKLRTRRLDLVPFTHEALEAAQAGDIARCERLLGAKAPAGWPPADVLEFQVPQQLQALALDPASLPWLGRVIVERESGMIAGGVNLKGPPREGACEVGYAVEPLFRRQGIATEAVRAVVEWALQQPGVLRVKAKTYPNNVASRGVLSRLGFSLVGPITDDRLGEMELHELTLHDLAGHEEA